MAVNQLCVLTMLLCVIVCAVSCETSPDPDEHTWISITEEGDKPGGAIVLIERAGKVISGRAYIIDRNLPCPFSNGVGYTFRNLSQKDRVVNCDVTIRDAASKTGTTNRHLRIAFEGAFTDDEIRGDIQEEGHTEKLAVVFRQRVGCHRPSSDQEHEWVSLVQNGDRPAMGLVVTEMAGRVTAGKAYILDPNLSRPLSESTGYTFKNLSQKGETIRCDATVGDESSQVQMRTTDMHLKITFKGAFTGDEIGADIQIDGHTKMLATVFLKTWCLGVLDQRDATTNDATKKTPQNSSPSPARVPPPSPASPSK